MNIMGKFKANNYAPPEVSCRDRQYAYIREPIGHQPKS